MKRFALIPGLREVIKANIANGHFLPILARHDIYLEVYKSNGPRFAEMFKATWKRLPLGRGAACSPTGRRDCHTASS
jgi:hypothetical protein